MAAKKKTEDAPAADAKSIPNKSEFSRGILEKDAGATAATAVSAWVSAEYPSDEGTLKKLKQSFNNYKTLWNKRQGGSAKPKGKPGRKPGVKAVAAAPSTNGTASGYDAVELYLDKAIVAAMNLNDDGLAASLRVARREVIKKSL